MTLAKRSPLNLDAMFRPRSIALIGASSNLTKLSGRPLRFLKEYGYPGKIYPINPNYPEIADGFKCSGATNPLRMEIGADSPASAQNRALIHFCT